MSMYGSAQLLPQAIEEHFSRILDTSVASVTPGNNQASTTSMAPVVAEPRSSVQFRPSPLSMPRSPVSFTQGPPQVPLSPESPESPRLPFASKVTADILSPWVYFPMMFTMSCIFAFLNPVWITFHLGQDRTVEYWLGPWCKTVIFFPVIFLIGHAVHLRKQLPYKPIVMLCLLFPTIYLLVLSDATLTGAHEKADQLFSTDCDLFPAKRELERSWVAARDLYEKCLQDTVHLAPASQNLTYATAAQLYKIQDCDEYATEERLHGTNWEYLWYLEDEYNCGGFCRIDKPLWTFNEVHDSCSVAVAQVFNGKVVKRSGQMVLYSLVMIGGVAVVFLTAGPFMRSRGYDW